MTVDKELLGPRTPDEEVIYAVEGLAFDLQCTITAAMRERGLTPRRLAEADSEAGEILDRVLGDKAADVHMRDIAKLAHAIGVELEVVWKEAQE